MKKRAIIFLVFTLTVCLFNKTFGQDLDPVTPTLQTIPSGSYVIAMDDTLQKDPTYNVFNIRAYGLLATILDNRIELLWAIRAGKVKDDTDFTAIATRVFPTSQAAATRRFRAGPFLVSIVDTVGLSAIINTFNAANNGHAINVYQLTAATTVDIRYTLNQIPKAAVLNDGGNASIMLNYMTLASIPSTNYRELTTAVNLSDSCYTFASEPHNNSPVAAVIDSIHAFVTNNGGNFLAQCAAVNNYENAATGRFQTTVGVSVNPIPTAGYTLSYPHSDLSFTQYEGNFDGYAIGGVCNTWELAAGSALVNNGSWYDQYEPGADSVIACQSVSKNGTGVGHLVFYAGGHDYGMATDPNHVNGMRSYFNAMFTPSNVTACAFLIFDNDLAVTKTAKPATLLLNQPDTFTMVIKNLGPSSLAATNVSAVDTIPAGFTFVSSYASKGSYNSVTHVWLVGTMNNSEADTLIIVATAVSSGSITNTIFINKEKYDFNQANDTARATVIVRTCTTVTGARDTTICSGNSVILGASIKVSGGTLPYVYSWSPSTGLSAANIPNPTASPVISTNYIVTITDSMGCINLDTILITVNPLPSITAGTGSASYCSGSTIMLNSTPSGGTTPYNYNWSGPSGFSSTQQSPNLPNATTAMVGTYSVTITDANLCTAINSATIPLIYTPINATATLTTVSCFGGNNGAISLSVTGGTSPYTYNWGGGTTTQNRTNLLAGTFEVTITDANLCSTTSTAVITQPAAALSAVASQTAVSCFGGNNGAIGLSVTGGTFPYTYNWGGGITTQNRTNLLAGAYDVTVTDANLCSTTSTAVIAQPAAALSATTTPTAVSCFGGNNGAISLSITGGTSPYTYNWGAGITTQNRTNLSAGTFDVTVTDANLCSTTGTAIITQPAAALSAVAGSTAVSCFGGNNGATSLSVTGGTFPYTYNWGGGITTQNRSNLSAGTFDVTVTDANLCSTTGTAIITQPAAALNAVAIPTAVSCFGGNNGAIGLSVTGGTSPYTYNWGSGITTQNRSNLLAGTFDVTVTDINLCSTTGTAIIAQPTAALSAVAGSTAVSCFGGNNGAISLSVTGGTSPYIYNWGGGITTQNRTNLLAGTFEVTVTDINLCSTTGTAIIAQPAAALSAVASPIAVSCFGGNNGAISLSVTGGTSPYTYNWGGGITTQNRTNLASGTYQVSITDANLCSTISTTIITQPAAALSAVASPTAVSCFGGNNSAISLSVTGGTSPYTYNWGAGITTQNRSNLSAGTFDVTVTDANLCSTTSTAIIAQPAAALSAVASPTAVSCFGGNNGVIGLSITGGTSPYTYNWGGGITTQNRTNLSAGTYDVTVTDANLCSTISTAVISQPAAALSAVASPTAVSCFGGNNGAISLSVTGGTSPYTYNWGGGITTQNRTNLLAGTFDVTVTDINLCSTTGTAIITQPAAALGAVASPTAVSCFGGNNGAISLSVTGGTSPYTYNWGAGITTQDRSNLSAGTYDVTVTDANLCSTISTAVISQPAAALSAVASPTAVSCFGGNNGATSLSVTGGTFPYTYNWGGGITTQNRSNLSAGTFDVTVTDANLCSTTGTAVISQPAAALSAVASPTAVSCFGGNNGAIGLSVTGGTSPYTYNWGGGITTQNRTNLLAGTFDVTVTDANLCSTTSTTIITQPAAALSAVASPTAVSCFGGNNGTISLNVTGGTFPYTYNWGGGITTQNRSNLSAGTFDVTVTDANLCSTISTAVISQPAAALSAVASPTAVSCFGGNNGAISLSVTGGTSPYTYNWGGGITAQNRTNLLAGTFDVTVTDINLCSTTGTAIIAQPAAALSAVASPTAVSCFGGNNGAISLSITGGTSPYTYNWGAGITTQNRSNLSAGTFDVTVTDVNLCSTTSTAIIAQPAATLSAVASPTAVSCFGGNNGTISLGVTGGTSPYTYNWGGGITTRNRTNLLAGTFDVTVTDANLCSTTSTAIIAQPAAALSAVASPTAVSCFGGNNGAISLSVTGGTSPYTYNWGAGITTQNRSNLSAGTFDVTVTDANLCSTTSTAIIAQPAAALSATTTPTAVSCFGGNNGAITLSVTGGTSPYTYNWSGGITTQNRSNLSAGTFDVTVTDANLCSTISTAVISQPAAALSAVASPTAVSCFGGNNGAISLSVTGGTSPYTYNWGAGITTQNRSNLSAGTFDVTVTDVNLCSTTSTAIIAQPAATLSAVASPTAVSCFGGNNGTISLGVTGGTSPYTYNWGGGITTRNRTNLLAGTFDVTVTDANLCSTTSTAIIAQPAAALSAVASPTAVSCFGGNNGAISLSVTGGTSPYTYNWGAGITTQNRSNLSAGTFDVTVTDANLCSTTSTAIIAQPAAALSATTTPTAVSCFGGNNGAITLSVTGGTSPYTYNWSGGITTQNRSNLSAGTFDVTVTDANLCSTISTAVISQPAAALSAVASPTAVSCFGGNNGAISLSVTGGTSPYTYNWGAGITTQNRSNLSAGTFDVTVTDANLCSTTSTAIIAQPAAALSATTTPTAVSCFGGNNGAITLSVTGGTSPYTYNWGGGITTQNRSNLLAGTFDVTVTDANLCSTISTAVISQPAAALSAVASPTAVSCFGGNNGAISLSVTGGTSPYTYNWGGGITTQNRTNLLAGTFDVTVTDINLCSTTGTAIITQPAAAFSAVASPTAVSCFGGNNGAISLSVTGGTSPYIYNWGAGITTQDRSNLSAGTFDVTVTDANLCSTTSTAIIAQPAAALSAVASPTAVSCFGGNNGAISLTVTGGTSPYTYNWGGGITTQNRSNLSAGTFDVTVTDANLCSTTSTTIIAQPAAALSAVASPTAVSCFGGNNGAISLSVTGGTSPYTYNWGGGITTQNRTNLLAGTFEVTVTDANLCSTISTAIITQPAAALSAVASPTAVSCFGGNNGAISLSVTGGTSPYTYNWGAGITTQNRSNLSAGTFDVTVTDINLCSTTGTAIIAQPAAALSAVASPTAVSCFGGNNGAIGLSVTGGTSPYTYNWGGGITTQNRSNLSAGTFDVTVTDANLCSTTSTTIITQPAAALSAVASPTAVSCFGGNNGAISLSVTGGTSPYTYNWGAGITTQDRSNLSAGTYDVTVTDANLCSTISTAVISQPAAALSAVASPTAVSCFGGNNGAISLSVTGGTSPYTYNWGAGITTQNRSNLSAGTFDVTVTDINLCSTTGTAIIAQPAAALSAVASPTAVSCFGGNNGAIGLSVTGGTSPYTYNWGGGITTQNRSNLSAGTFDVTVTDANLCSTISTAVISQPAAALSAVASPTAVSCFGGSNGAISLSVNDGTTPYTYNWGSGIKTQNRNDLSAGTYYVTVTDRNLCSTTSSANIAQPATTLNAAATTTGVSCFGGSNGVISLSVNGGTTPYTYNWGSGIKTQNRNDLSAGTYYVTVTDRNLCSTTSSANISQPATALNAAATTTGVSCFGGSNGAISLSVDGGTTPYTYNWGSGIKVQNRSDLSAGTYYVTVTDRNLCSTTSSANIAQPATTLNAAATTTGVSCFGGNNGAISLSVSGGTSPYTYNWGSGIKVQNRSDLSAGTYYVTVTDRNLCSTTSSANISQPATALNAAATTTGVSCFGGNNGAISLSVDGGTTPYTYNWGSGIKTQNRSDLSAGTYHVTVTDANGCSTIISKTISQPTSALNAAATITGVSCFNGNNGAISLSASGGNSPYTFNWGGGINTQNRANLAAGTYHVTITDANSCSTIASAAISQPVALNIAIMLTPVNCFGGNNGAVNLNVSGGTSPYSFNWGGGVTTQSRNSLPAGTYDVTITDANGCLTTASASIIQPVSLLNVNAITTGISCFGENNGKVTANIAGGTSPYQLQWNNGATTESIIDLAAGNYSLTVTDAQGCIDTDYTNIISLPEFMLNINGQDLACENATGNIYLSANNGATPYSYIWSNGATTQNLTGIHPGSYSVTVEDAYGCAADTSITIKNLNTFSVNAWGGGTTNLGQSVALYAMSSDSAGTTYNWAPATGLSCAQCAITTANPDGSTVYTVVATDTDGCVATGTVLVNVIDNHNIFIPNAFSPNGDGNNDYFQIYGNLAGIEYIDAMVFDRWGEKVFESEEPDFKWDGTYKGVLQNPNVYVYVIKIVFLDGYSNPLYKGSVTLVR